MSADDAPDDRLQRRNAAPQLVLPASQLTPFRSLLQRFAVAAGVIAVIAALAYFGRSGYSDADGTRLSVLDAIYYSTVTVTTTGYGDIAPLSPGARAVTAFIVTPLRIVFVIVLVGTTLQLLAERYRQVRAENHWRKRVSGHTIIVGYGTMGRTAAESLRSHPELGATDLVVIDLLPEALARASERGFVGVLGDATRTETLHRAHIRRAAAVVVTCNRDDTAALVTLTAREMNPQAIISAAVREAENAHLLSQSGATTVVLSSEAAGRLVGLSTRAPEAVDVLQDLMQIGTGIDLEQRTATAAEVGQPPNAAPGHGMPIAIIRGGSRLTFRDPGFARVEAGDVLVVLRARPTGPAASPTS